MNWWIFAWGMGVALFGFYTGWVMGAGTWTPWRKQDNVRDISKEADEECEGS